MARIAVGHWQVDTIMRSASGPAGTCTLSANEVALLAYLSERDTPVARAEILTEVFGYAPSARSRAVDMAIKRLRDKLEEDPSEPAWVRSKRTVGVWLEASQPPTATVPAGLRFGTPYHPREHDEGVVLDMVDGGWRVVSIVGPGGVGKTRLALEVAQRADGKVLVVPVGGARTSSDVLHRIAEVGGVVSGGVEALQKALGGVLCLLDEAESAFDAVRTSVEALEGLRFLVTSRRPLDVVGEAVHTLRGLTAEEGRTFLTSRLAASRWNDAADDALVSEVLTVVDGLPLALELAAAHPDGLDRLMRQLREGRVPRGGWLDETLARSIEPLPPEDAELLRHLCVAEAPLTREDVASWLGEEADLTRLADQSLLERQGTGWTVLRTVRGFVLQRDATDAHQRAWDTWLVQRALELEQAFERNPAATAPRWVPLLHAMSGAVDRVDPSQLFPLVRALLVLLDALGPAELLRDIVRRALARSPDDLALRVLGCVLPEALRDAELLQEAFASDHLRAKVLALEFYAGIAPWMVDVEQARALLEAPLDPLDRGRVERDLARHAARASDAPESLDAPIRASEPFPLMQTPLLMARGGIYRRAGRTPEALACFDQALDLAMAHGLRPYELVIRQWRATVLGSIDPAAGARALVGLVDDVERAGLPGHTPRALASLLFYAAGELDEAARHLHAGVQPGMLPSQQLAARLAIAITRARREDSSVQAALDLLDPSVWTWEADDPKGPALRAWAEGEAQLDAARREGRTELPGLLESCATHREVLRRYSYDPLLDDLERRARAWMHA